MAAPRMLQSPALDVPPEPAFSVRPAESQDKASPPNSPATATAPAPTADLAEQLDAAERHKYVKGRKLGSGQYADVFSAHLATDPTQLVAIKKIKVGAEAKEFGISYDSLREIRFLQELRHPNIIRLISVYSTKGQNLNLVLEQLPQGDLLKLIQDTQHVSYTASDIKAWMLMVLRAVWFCHRHFVLHRDIKPNNLLIAGDGAVKLADFGLARRFADPYQPMTCNTVTIWYRPPELFFHARYYADRVDVWSCGCVFAELVARDVLFRAWPESEVNMVKLICEKVGTPTEANWPGVTSLPAYLVPHEPHPLRTHDHWMSAFGAIGPDGVDLLIHMLRLDPRRRCSAEQALNHPFWSAQPRPSLLHELPRRPAAAAAVDPPRHHPSPADLRTDRVARKIDFGAKP